ncbi:MAG: winged helix-turn-helix domain-containing protein [Actinomycetota bacterium]
MKENLHSSVDTAASASDGSGERRVVEDVAAVRALANPHRVAILHYLLSGPARTATECAAEVGGTASACSYHLRELERFGLVERAESTGDARTRPWRAAAVGFSIGTGLPEESPSGRAAEMALTRAGLVENQRLIKRFLDGRDSIDPEWRSAGDFHTYELVVTPAELIQLNNKIGELLRSFRAPTRTDAPEDAQAVHVIYQAFPRLPAPA